MCVATYAHWHIEPRPKNNIFIKLVLFCFHFVVLCGPHLLQFCIVFAWIEREIEGGERG